MGGRYIAGVLSVLTLRLALAQSGKAPPAFEVASVRPSQSRERASVATSPGGLIIDGTLAYTLAWAFDLKRFQITGPDWMRGQRYRILARAAGPSSDAVLRQMLQTLLAERFKLACHRDNKEFTVWAMVVAKAGSKLRESDTEGESVTKTDPKRPGSGGTSLRTSMAQLADLLDGALGPEPVLDMTGLKGRYDFTLDFGSYLNGIQPGDMPALLNDAMQKQLGLNLEHRKVSLEVLVVDHVEKASVEN
jgi:uncharacterized protein (TIGR03435 family)